MAGVSRPNHETSLKVGDQPAVVGSKPPVARSIIADENDLTESQMHFSDVLSGCENAAFEVVISKKNKRLLSASPSSDDAQSGDIVKKRILEVEPTTAACSNDLAVYIQL